MTSPSNAYPNSRIFYRGPSQLDGAPILGIVTGLATPSTNTKTGDMLQTYILREDVSPPAAVVSGADRSICGDCALRGDGSGLGRSCYVQTKWAPLAVWKFVDAWGPWDSDDAILALSRAKHGRFVRLGTYGDPTAIPLYVWEWLLYHAAGWTGYTHQWRTCDRQFQQILMASVDTIDDYQDATAAGWRTFRTRGSVAEALTRDEVVCPASAEAGHRVTCQQCQLCRGASRPAKSIAIVAHGSRSRKYGTLTLPFEREFP